MFKELNEATTLFEQQVWVQLHTMLFDPDKNQRGFETQIKAQALAADVLGLALIVGDLYDAAIVEVRADHMQHRDQLQDELSAKEAKQLGSNVPSSFQSGKALGAPDRPLLEREKFGAGFKAFFYAIRAFQDGMYQVGLCATGNLPGGHDSGIKKAIDVGTGHPKKTNPVGAIVFQSVPGYGEWLRGMRQMRNAIKTGVGVGFQSGTNYITGVSTVELQMQPSSGDKPVLLALSDVMNALWMSTELTKAIIFVGKTKGLLAPRFG